VYRINDQLALVQTVDFFPPMVDDPYVFGQIAAANALSDIYAMGGRPSHALNLLCYPECLEPAVVSRILEGGYAKVAEAGAVIAGGHSINAPEPMYGLCVSGFIDPSRVLANHGAKKGDKLILTKPLGSGILATAAKGDVIDAAALQPAIDVMTQLNRAAVEIAAEYDIHACTDVTGFGLLGHALEMIGDAAGLLLDSRSLPLIAGAYEMAALGLIPAGAYNNRSFVAPRTRFAPDVDPVLSDILCDPQTSGGLLLAVAAAEADDLLAALRREHKAASLIGEVVAGNGVIEVR
jgi:selenide, water dikinase